MTAVGNSEATTEKITKEWNDMPKEAKANMTDKLQRELFAQEIDDAKDDLATSKQRETFVEQQATALTAMVCRSTT